MLCAFKFFNYLLVASDSLNGISLSMTITEPLTNKKNVNRSFSQLLKTTNHKQISWIFSYFPSLKVSVGSLFSLKMIFVQKIQLLAYSQILVFVELSRDNSLQWFQEFKTFGSV